MSSGFLVPDDRQYREKSLCIFCISDGQNAFLYGNDTGLLPESTFEALARYGKKIAAVSLDCSRGTLPGDAHMGISECRQTRSRLLDIGVIDKNTVVYLNHFSHVCGMIPEEFARLAYKDSMNLTYDGLTVTLPA
jgi:phosphoribosyl 1,2-cyclic phosphate phosphodiesterase